METESPTSSRPPGRAAAGDVNHDGFADIIAGAGPGGAPVVMVYSGKNLARLKSFFAYSRTFTGGVNVAAGDVNGDGRADVITGAGPGGGQRVMAFDGKSGAAIRNFLAFGGASAGGIRVASGD